MDFNNDALRCKFTAWMKVVVKRAKLDYIRRLNRHSNEISIEDEHLPEKLPKSCIALFSMYIICVLL